jgi:cytochrome c oxidase subunit 3
MSPARLLHEPWRSPRRQDQAASFGMWIFLGSEALLFGGLLLAFATTQFLHAAGFAEAGRETEVMLGTANTLVLLTSSMAVAVAVEAGRAERRRLALGGLAVAVLLGLAFLAVKGFEWHSDIAKGLLPGRGRLQGHLAEVPGAALFLAFYWLLTGLHGLHVVGGLSLLAFVGWQIWRGSRPLGSPALEAAGLYWHLVDVIWVLLYPLLYLGGRAS